MVKIGTTGVLNMERYKEVNNIRLYKCFHLNSPL